MSRPAPIPYTDDNLRHIVSLNPKGVSLQSIAKGFGLGESSHPELRRKLDALCTEGFAFTDKKDFFTAVSPMSEVVVARVAESLKARDTKIKLSIKGLPEDHPAHPALSVRAFQKKFPGQRVYPNTELAVIVSRQHGFNLVVTHIIDKVGFNHTPRITGVFREKAGEMKFVPTLPGVKTFFNASGSVPDKINQKTSFYAHIPADMDPYNPTVDIGERKWDPDTGMRIATVIAQKHGIKPYHKKKIIRESMAEIQRPAPYRGRRDLTDERILVIDPDQAKDHDDGILIERTRDGYRTLVVISDVPYHVRPGTLLDEAARQRGFTHYLRDDTFHMLPSPLVGHASLLQGRARPVIYVEQFWDESGNKEGEAQIGAGYIASHRQLTYGQFEDLVISQPNNIRSYIELGDILVERMRTEKVTFDMDDSGRQSSYSQAVVAALMIEANSAIASLLQEQNIPFLSRTHTGNDNIYAFHEVKNLLEGWGYEVPDHIADMTNETLRRIIARSEERGQKREVETVIRSNFLNLAMYSTIPYGHFGLNRENYTHATSPIRRYPDILTLRGIHSYLGNHDIGLSDEDIDSLPQTAREMNRLQDISRRINNDVQKYYMIRELYHQEGSLVRGMIGRIDRFGAEIVLDKWGGLSKHVPFNELPENWKIAPNAKSLIYNNIYVIPGGSRVRLRIENVEPHKAKWDFSGLEPLNTRDYRRVPYPALAIA